MPAAQTWTCQQLIDRANYELRNEPKRQYSDAEMFEYVQKVLEMLYMMLVHDNSEIIAVATTSFPTVVSQELYDLTLTPPNAADLWTVRRAWITGYEGTEIEMTEEENRYAYLESGTEGRPVFYYLEGDDIGLLPFPDAVYTLNLRYYPNYVPPATAASVVPFKNLFNLEIVEAIKVIAKNREGMDFGVDTSLMEMFSNRAFELNKHRRKRKYQIRPIWRN